MSIQNVVVAGGGVLGSQIAYQTAFKGFHVTIWLRSEASIARAQPKLEKLYHTYAAALDAMKPLCGSDSKVFPHGIVDSVADLTEEKIEFLKAQAKEAYESIILTTSLEDAAKDADLVIEAVAEEPASKIAFYTQLAPLLPEHAILVTNSSTMLPSAFAGYTGRPDKYLALHFANSIWSHNTAEVMGHDGTSAEAYDATVEFAKQISMIPLCLHKEQPGYILNSLMIPLVIAGGTLYVNGVADPETIDLTWRTGTGAIGGPFQILDVIGLTTAYNVIMLMPEAGDPASATGKIAADLKAHIDAGKTGVAAGEGYYKYR